VLIISRALSTPIVIASQELIGSRVAGFGPADFLHILERGAEGQLLKERVRIN